MANKLGSTDEVGTAGVGPTDDDGIADEVGTDEVGTAALQTEKCDTPSNSSNVPCTISMSDSSPSTMNVGSEEVVSSLKSKCGPNAA